MRLQPISIKRRNAQALVEFAFVLPVLLLLLMMVLDFGRAIYGFHTISNAARAGVRTAVIDQSNRSIVDSARSQTTGLPPDQVEVNISPTLDPCAPTTFLIGSPITVIVQYTYTPLTPIIGNIFGPHNLSSTTQMPVERVFSSATCP